LAAANRDPEMFRDPERLDLSRNPNPHISFGFGPHYCLGTSLARAEGITALRTLFERASGLALLEAPTYRATLIRRALRSLWVELR
jgi:cytochrome P450